jgi:hypothetical protein
MRHFDVLFGLRADGMPNRISNGAFSIPAGDRLVMKICAKCGKTELLETFPIRLGEHISPLFLLRPYRCAHCNFRMLRFAWWWERRRKFNFGHKSVNVRTLHFDESVVRPAHIDEVRTSIRQNEERQKLAGKS